MELFLNWFFPGGIKTSEAILLIIGFLGQGLFSARFLIQWVVSEKRRESVIPLPFWYFSLLGGITLFIYAFSKKDLVIMVGQGTGILIYTRNLYLIYRKRRIDRYETGENNTTSED
ncbi:MAG: hypothetical protein CMM58_12295 [Rhodospirillaceae bacterium]|nr:hypothetical protein [Rhodospirillaceae bacterium]|tara:strand:+ start:4104 stop:4451 length:348 start_codon:yes stop_codon:yes gene_type:complete